MIDEIKKLLADVFPNSASLQLVFSGQARLRIYKKGQTILEVGQIETKIHYLAKGFIRGYVCNNEGNRLTTWFKFSNSVATSVFSYATGMPSRIGIEAIENSIVLEFDKSFIEKMMMESEDIRSFYRKEMEMSFVNLENMLMDMQTKSAQERYDALMQNNPELLLKAPLGHVASYLGVTQATLSRLRGR